MKECFLLFPINLFRDIKLLSGKDVYIIEDKRFFCDFGYHKLKLAFHRASMKYYFDFLKNKLGASNVKYVEFVSSSNKFYKDLSGRYDKIYMYEPFDLPLEKKIKKLIGKVDIVDSLNFTLSKKDIYDNKDIFCHKGKCVHKTFYEWQRKRLGILITKSGGPVGGKWSFDKENRKPLPKNVKIPEISLTKKESKKTLSYKEEAKKYIEKHFSGNYGSLENFIYPIDHESSIKWLKEFTNKKFKSFGEYEDAESQRNPFLFHSVITPMLNIGLLTDFEVLKIVLPYQSKVPLADFEGYIRQVIGWRNYMVVNYVLFGESMKKMNFFKHKNRIPKSILWTAKTELMPMDYIIKKFVDYSYAHHIERLMYIGNFFLICQVNPKQVYEMFMEWTIDAYDWVMIPNVFGMSQFADGGMMMTRPYYASSNYILKMSDYSKGDWCDIIDCLYYSFINKHKKFLRGNYATATSVINWNKKSSEEKKRIIRVSNNYLKNVLHCKK